MERDHSRASEDSECDQRYGPLVVLWLDIGLNSHVGENLKLSYARSAEDSYKVAIQKAHASSIDEAPIARPELILDRDPSVYHLYVESVSGSCP